MWTRPLYGCYAGGGCGRPLPGGYHTLPAAHLDVRPRRRRRRPDSWAPSWSSAGQYFDACYFAPYVRGTVCNMTAAMGDDLAPLSRVIALYNALDTDKQISFDQNGRHNETGGGYNKVYQIQGDPVSFDLDEVVILDNGYAQPQE